VQHAKRRGGAILEGKCMTSSSPRISSREVAQAADVSANTVSLVVRDSPRISEQTKVRVREVIARLGYRPHAAARALRSARSGTLGYLVPEVPKAARDVFRHQLLSAMITAARARGYHLLVDTLGDADSCMALLRSGRIDGALIDWVVDDTVLERLVAANAPVVLVGRDGGDLPVSWVKADEEEGAYRATRHLLEQGHRVIGLLAAGDEATNAIVRERTRGYRRALHEASLAADPACTALGDWTFEAGCGLAHGLLMRESRPTALFALNELMAVGALDAARRLGLRVPMDLAIATVEDSPWVEYVWPALTGTHVPMYEVGTRATEALFAVLDDGALPPRQITLPTHLIVRASTLADATQRPPMDAPPHGPDVDQPPAAVPSRVRQGAW